MLALLAFPVEADILEMVLVKVNGDIITKTEFEKRQIAYLIQSGRQDVLNDDARLATVLAEVTPQIILNIVDELIFSQRGRELGFALDDDAFEEIVVNLKEQNDIENDEQFAEALVAQNMTMAELRLALERQMLISRVQQVEVFGRFSVTDEEERAYYEANLGEFSDPPTVTLREILAEVPDGTSDGSTQPMFNVGLEEQAKARIDEIQARIAGGEEFASVAGDVSDAPSRANGGLVGPLLRDELASTFIEALQALEVGEVSDVVRTTRGYHLIKLESATLAVPKPFDDVRGTIAEKIFSDRRVEEVNKYLGELRAQAIFDWKNDELKAAYERGLESQARQLANRPTS